MALNNVPLTGQTLNVTRPLISQNFSTIDTAFSVNHVAYGSGDQGKHKFVSMPEQGSDAATAVNEMALYTKDVAGVSQLFLRNENNGTVVNFTGATAASNGTTTLPSGLILKWGQTTGGTLPGNSWTQITFPVAFPNNCFSIQVSPKTVTPQPSTAQTTTLIDLSPDYNVTRFYVYNRRTDAGGGIAADCTYFAIGN